MLADLGFVAVPEAGKKPGGKQKGKRKRHSAARVLWQQPYGLGQLHLDRAALQIVAARSAPGKEASVPAGAQDLCHLCAKVVSGKRQAFEMYQCTIQVHLRSSIACTYPVPLCWWCLQP